MTEDAEIVREFVAESHERMDRVERDLADLERELVTPELLGGILRELHTVKGLSGLLGFERLESITHHGEALLSQLRDGCSEPTPRVPSALLLMTDTVRSLLDVVQRTGADVDDTVRLEPAVDALTTSLAGPAGRAVPAADARPTRSPAVGLVGVWASGEPKLGELLVATGAVTAESVADAVALQLKGDARPLGELLVALGAIDRPGLERALTRQRTMLPGPDEARGPGDRRHPADTTVRVGVELLDALMEAVNALVLTRDQVLAHLSGVADLESARLARRLDLEVSRVQEGVSQTRMQPIGQTWARMPRLIRDLAVQLNRKVDLEMDGHEIELDRAVLEALSGPLTHMIRNALDHGLEPPLERLVAGKSEAGRLSLRALHEGGRVVIEVADDGRGVDAERVGAIAVANGLVSGDELHRMRPCEVQQLIFRPGFTTTTEVTKVSGRGVGMDVVATEVGRLGGSVELASRVGHGTTFRLRIPVVPAVRATPVARGDRARTDLAPEGLVEVLDGPRGLVSSSSGR